MHNRKLLLLLFPGIVSVGACRDREEPVRYRGDLKGRVTAINLNTGEVEMSWFNVKQNREMPLKGKLAPDAEILINGSTARLEDVHTDDRVTVEGRVEKRNGEMQLVATKVRVERPEAASAPAGSQPASRG
jgi:hypothetical protein